MILQNIKNNFKSGITVALISIPLSISLAVASNASPLIGIITAIWAGLFAAVFGGSNFNIVGPTGALSGIIATYVILHGIGGLPVLAVITGLIILAAYFLKLERYLVLIPSSVIHGFTLGVASGTRGVVYRIQSYRDLP
jgi:SulP family sulfate permease